MNGRIETPFTFPAKTSISQPRKSLTEEQTARYKTVVSTVSTWNNVPEKSTAGTPKDSPITESERMWLTRECLLRYLRATKWSATEAASRLLGTLTWRREYDIAGHSADYVSIEGETGKQVILGYDNDARTVLYMNPGKQNTQKSERQIHHLIFMLERMIDIMPPDVETWCMVINYLKSSSSQTPSIATGRQVSAIFQMHYPERLGRALMINRKASCSK